MWPATSSRVCTPSACSLWRQDVPPLGQVTSSLVALRRVQRPTALSLCRTCHLHRPSKPALSLEKQVGPVVCLGSKQQAGTLQEQHPPEEAAPTKEHRERPTLQPFVAPSSKQRRLVEFRHKESVQGGTLLIRPLSKNWLMPATDLLTATFAEAMGYLPVYRTYLRRQILQYLDSHMNLAPKSVILVAVLISDGHQPIPDDAARSSSFTTIAIEDVAARSDSLGSSSVRSSPEPERDSNGAGAGVPGSERASSAGSDASTSGREDDDAEERFGVLVGTGELSFAASTRTKFLTLNAPEDCGYLCNMAVAEDYQRRGFGMALLRALERTAEIVEQPNLYLHNRFQDDPAAALYKRAGYEVVKKDNFLMMLLGRDRRYLMRKRLQMKVPQES